MDRDEIAEGVRLRNAVVGNTNADRDDIARWTNWRARYGADLLDAYLAACAELADANKTIGEAADLVYDRYVGAGATATLRAERDAALAEQHRLQSAVDETTRSILRLTADRDAANAEFDSLVRYFEQSSWDDTSAEAGTAWRRGWNLIAAHRARIGDNHG